MRRSRGRFRGRLRTPLSVRAPATSDVPPWPRGQRDDDRLGYRFPVAEVSVPPSRFSLLTPLLTRAHVPLASTAVTTSSGGPLWPAVHLVVRAGGAVDRFPC